MDQIQELATSRALKEATDFKLSDFWKLYQVKLAEKKEIKEKDCVNLSEEKLYRAQGWAQALEWVIEFVPVDVVRDMGKPSAKA